MRWLDRLGALSSRTRDVVTLVAAICGLGGVGVGIATGSTLLLVAAYAVVFAAGLVPAVADWCEANAALEAIHRQNEEQSAIDTPQRCVETNIASREEAEAKIKAYYARLECEPDTGSGRFQELVSVQHQPGWDRVH